MNAPEMVEIHVRIDVIKPLSRSEVIRVAKGFVGPWTIEDLTEAMEERPYRVRAAVGWLIHQGRATPVGERVKVSPTGRAYSVTIYQLKSEKAADFAALYNAFGMKG